MQRHTFLWAISASAGKSATTKVGFEMASVKTTWTCRAYLCLT